MVDRTYKQRHEDFVSGLAGGNASEIYLVTFISAAGYATWCALQSRAGFFNQRGLAPRMADFVLNWMGPLLSMTLYSNMPLTLNALVLLPGVAVSLTKSYDDKTLDEPKKSTADALSEYLPKRSYLSVYRACMMVLTCLAILAVDFREFPRRFAKVETWGTSMMDLGVGSFVFSMGLVSARGTLVDKFSGKRTSIIKSMQTAVGQSASVLGLGLIRLLCVKFFDYQEHVTEYGVHWNFFMTLGFLPPFVALLWFIPRRVPLAVIALGIGLGYEAALDSTSLGSYILAAPRVDVISSNKEGIFSFFGYLSIFLAGKSTGYYTLPSSVSKRSFWFPQTRSEFMESKAKDSRWRTVVMLLSSAAVHHVLLQLVLPSITVSRRLANLSYVLWTVSYNNAFIAVFVAFDALLFSSSTPYKFKVPESLDALNYNGLAVFLLANISTGVVNMNIQTLDASRATTMTVLTAYSVVLFTVSILLYRYNIRIKI